ncbi:VanZ family protein [Polaribacter sp.]|jgi:VanZ family protein|uniref:VanZ family protein n=1 Tax=Polaribacter sp. TaxID=1920175 RepID=UPI003F699128
MLKRIKVLLLDKFIYFAIIITTAIICLSLLKLPNTNNSYSNIDKIYHLVAYFFLAISWLISFYKQEKSKLFVVFACIFFGIIIEYIQSNFTSYRTGDMLDIIANTIGVILALLSFNLIFKKKTIN